MELPNTRAQAKELGMKKYHTGIPCKHNHISNRWVVDGACYECGLEKRRKMYQKHKDKRLEYQKERYYEKQEQLLVDAKVYRESHKEQCNKSCREWRKKNPAYVTARSRRVRRQQRNLPWDKRGSINKIYKKRDELNKLWGTNFQVDHIIPLTNKTVCGLHVIANLQLLDCGLNHEKHNYYQQDW